MSVSGGPVPNECYWCHRTDVRLYRVGRGPWMTEEGIRYVCNRDRWWRWWDIVRTLFGRSDGMDGGRSPS